MDLASSKNYVTEDEIIGWHYRLNGHESEQAPGDLPNPGIEPGFPALQADSLPSRPPEEGAT